MERKLIVNLLRKNIEELAMITEGFSEMNEYPAVIIQLARRKTEDLLAYIHQLEAIKVDDVPAENPDKSPVAVEEMKAETEKEPETETENKENKEEDFQEEIIITEELVVEREIVVEAPQEEENKEELLREKSIFVTEVQRTVLTEKSDNTIAGAHNNKKIDDIRQAISIGDRFRFQRELFAGNGELMNKTLSQLNQMSAFDEAVSYLQSKFRWNEEDETAESFYQIVKRRYLDN